MNGLKHLISQNCLIIIPALILIIISTIIFLMSQAIFMQLDLHLFLKDLQILAPSIGHTLFNNIAAIAISIFVAFFITIYLYKYSLYKSSFLIVLISFPHISFCIGVSYLFASSGLFARLFSLFYGNEVPFASTSGHYTDNLIYIFGLSIREVPFLVLIGLNVCDKIKLNLINRQVQALGFSELTSLVNCVLPLWLKSMSLPILVVITFSFSNIEFSSILGPQLPNMINVKFIESWYSTNQYLIRQLNSLILITILCVIFTTLLLAFLRNLSIYFLKKTRFFIKSSFNSNLLGKIFYKLMISIFILTLLVTFLLSICKSWFFPSILPDTLSYDGWKYIFINHLPIFLNSIFISTFISFLSLIIIGLVIENTNKKKLLFKILFILSFTILILPQNIMLIGINDLMNITNIFSVKIWFYFSLFIYVLPYTYFMMKQTYDNFNYQYIRNANVLGTSRFKSLFLIKIPLISNELILIFAVGFAVCFYQFLQGIIVTKGEEILFNNEVFILFSGESINVASSGSLMNLIPALLLFLLIWIRGHHVKV
ncbi:MAG: hypothetical protein CMI90_06610 [Pelagibacteraceae bacterium]|nr:hypothetical protein [Pelagibacteraceae bacterium]